MPLNIFLLKGRGSRIPNSSLDTLIQNTLLFTPGAPLKFSAQYLLLSGTFLLCFSLTFHYDVSPMRAKPGGGCYYLHSACSSARHREDAKHLLKERIGDQVHFVLYLSGAYHSVRCVTNTQKLQWLLCGAILNIIAVGRTVSSFCLELGAGKQYGTKNLSRMF